MHILNGNSVKWGKKPKTSSNKFASNRRSEAEVRNEHLEDGMIPDPIS
jgi:hypothetical protein